MNFEELNLSLMPLQPQSKHPPEGRLWQHHQHKRASNEEIQKWLDDGMSLGCVCGEISDGLLVLDFDKQEFYPLWLNEVGTALNNPDFWKNFPIVETQKGTHLYLRCDNVPKSDVLSRDTDNKIIIETRGEGGYVVFPEGHESYTLRNGSLREIPKLDAKTLDLFLTVARGYSRTHDPAYVDKRFVGEGLPGDDYNNRSNWHEILPAYGWKYIRTRPDNVSEWTRPDKDFGLSATTNIHEADLLYVFTSNAFPLEANKGYSKFGFYTLMEHEGDFSAAAKALASEGYGAPAEKKQKISPVNIMLEMVEDLRWYEDGNGDVFVQLPGNNGLDQVLNGECEPLACYLDNRFFAEFNFYPSETQLKEAIIKIARHNEKILEPVIPMRVRHDGRTTYIDSGSDDSGIVIKPGSVNVEPLPDGVYFRRPAGLMPIHTSTGVGDIDSFRELINYADDTHWRLIIGWMTAALGMAQGTFPILMIAGNAGAAKSTGTGLIKTVLDPQSPELLSYPKSVEQVQFHSVYNYVMAYDNLSGVSNEVSDALCTMASGTGFLSRRLYTNLGRVALKVKRPVMLNGIDNVARRNDFASRTLCTAFRKLDDNERLEDDYIAQQVEKNLDKWRKECYTIISEVKKIDRGEVARPRFRLADFHVWLEMVGMVLGWEKDFAYDAMRSNENVLLDNIKDTDLVAAYLLAFMDNRAVWSGLTRELYEEVVTIVPPDVKRSSDWPNTLNGFGARIGRANEVLEFSGITVRRARKKKGTVITLSKEEK